MHRVEITDDVWNAIARRGKFGESVDDVLRREFRLPSLANKEAGLARGTATRTIVSHPRARGGLARRRRIATERMSSYVLDRNLVIDFQGGARKSFRLPERADKAVLRQVRDQAVDFARANGASYGQEMAVKKALTEAGYHLVK